MRGEKECARENEQATRGDRYILVATSGRSEREGAEGKKEKKIKLNGQRAQDFKRYDRSRERSLRAILNIMQRYRVHGKK